MKLPSLFKTYRYKRFEYEPRYYDKVKEDIQQRTRRIREELGKDIKTDDPRVSQIRGSFRNIETESEKKRIPFIFVLIILLSSATFGYIYFSKIEIFYTFVGITLVLSVLKPKLKIFK